MRCVYRPQLLFNRIKKSGNTSVKFFLSDVVAANAGADTAAVTPFEMSAGELRSFNQYIAFTVVRDPRTRCLSAYLQKSKSRNAKYAGVPGFAQRDAQGFASFVSFLESGGMQFDAHFWPQVDLLFLPLERYNYICRLERLDMDLPPVIKAAGLELPDGLDLGRPHDREAVSKIKVTGASGKMEEFYTPALLERVERLYEADMIAFGYGARP